MTKINKPEYFVASYVKFEFEKIIEHHSARGEWKYIPYIKEYKNLFVKMPNGDIFDVQSMNKVNYIDFDDLNNYTNNIKNTIITNLMPLSKYYLDEKSFLQNMDLALELLNLYLEQSGSWINKNELILNESGNLVYTGKINEKQRFIMTFMDKINLAMTNNSEITDNNSYEIEDNLYIGYIISEEKIAYESPEDLTMEYKEFIRNLNFKLNPRVKILKKIMGEYIDVYTGEVVNVIDDTQLSQLKESEKQKLSFVIHYLHKEKDIGVASIIPLSKFLNESGIIIDNSKNIEEQINDYYEKVVPFHITDNIPTSILPRRDVILTRNLTK